MDAAKEMSIRISDGTADDALKKLGLNADEIKTKFTSGGTAAREALTSIKDAIGNVTSATERYTILQALAGTQFEDLGEEGTMALFELEGAANASKNALEAMSEIAYDNMDNKLEGIKRNVQAGLLPAFEKLVQVISENEDNLIKMGQTMMGAFSDGIMFVTNNLGLVETVLKSLLAMKVANHFETQLTSVYSVVKSVSTGIIDFGSVMKQTITTSNTTGDALKNGLGTAFNAVKTGASTAVSSLKNFVGNLSMGAKVGIAVAALQLLKAAYDKVTEKQRKLQEELNKMDDEFEEHAKSIDDFYKEINDGAYIYDTSSNRANELISKLYELDGQTNKTKAEINEMELIVAELNEIYPELALSINNATGELNMQELQCRNTADELYKLEKLKYYQGKYGEAVQKEIEAEEKYNEKLREHNELQAKRGELMREWQELDKKSGDGYWQKGEFERYQELSEELFNSGKEKFDKSQEMVDQYRQELVKTQEETSKVGQAMQETGVLAEEAGEKIEKSGQAQVTSTINASDCVSRWTAELQKATNATIELEENSTKITNAINKIGTITTATSGDYVTMSGTIKTSLGEISFETENCASTVEAKSKAWTQVKEQIVKSYNEMKESAIESLEGQIGLFDKWNQSSKTSGQELMNNLQSQITGLKDWNKNITEIASRVPEEFAAELRGMGVSASAEIAALNSLSDSELNKYVDLWRQKHDLVVESVDNGMGSVEDHIKAGLANMNELFSQNDLATHSYAMIEKAAQVIKDNPSIPNAVAQQGVDAILEWDKQQKNFEKAGVDTVNSICGGIDSNKNNIPDSVEAQGSAAIQAWKNSTDKHATGLGKGFVDDIIGGMEEGERSIPKAAEKLSGAALQQFENSTYGRAHDSGVKTTQEIADGISDGKRKVTDATAEVAKDGDDAYNKNYDANKGGQTWSKETADGIKGNAYKVRDAAEDVGDTADDGFKADAAPESTGKWYTQGVADGIRNNSYLAKSAANSLADNVKNSINSRLGIHSPSRVGMEQGMWYDKGIALGMTNNLDSVKKAANAISSTMVNGVNMDGIGTKLQQLTTSASISTNHNVSLNIDYDKLGRSVAKAMESGQFTIDKNATVKYIEKNMRGVYR